MNLKIKTTAALLAFSIGLFSLVGCTSQTTAAALVTTLGTTVAAVETIEGNTSASAKIAQDTQAASTAITSWVSGSPTQEIDEALNLVISDLSVLPVPVSTTDKALLALSVSTAEELLADYSTPSAAAALSYGTTSPASTKALVVSDRQLVKLSRDYKTHANSIIAHDPSRASIKIK